MNVCDHCRTRTRESDNVSQSHLPDVRRLLILLRSAVPFAIWLLMPKCPACLAAYIALLTGAAVSVPTAAHVRLVIIGISMASLGAALFAWRRSPGMLRR